MRGEQGEGETAPEKSGVSLAWAAAMKKTSSRAKMGKPEINASYSLLEKVAFTAGGLLLVVFTIIGMEFTLHGSHISRLQGFGSAAPVVGDSLFVRTMEMFTGTHLTDGNHVTVLMNGEQTFPAIWKDLRGAKQTITMQMYYFEPGKIADTLSAILRERARAGVSVHLLTDAFGANKITKGYVDSLEADGVHTSIFRPVHWYEMQKLQNRSHIRAIIVDGRVGFTGGFGIADKWLGNGHVKDQWRDTDVRFTGPAVSQLQATFAEGWVEATGNLLTGEKYFPKEPVKEEPAEMVGLLNAQPTIGSTPAERFLALSIAGARHHLYIANSYFVPNHDFKNLLIEAAKRGVDVRVLTVGPNTDVKITRYAGRKQYDDLLKGGVRIWEFAPTMMHAKTIVADGEWASIGTMNFDNRSMVFNNESNLNILDAPIGAMLDSVFLNDLEYSKEITRAEFEKRGVWQRLCEYGASAMARLL
ncbi:MAG: phospholipase D-like domain-containing protein [Gemmatimonadota bacterium]|nr:phospholipase D-like domain-containing protein [Gemmatimonadota bacterium]